uniref:Helix-turn-helix domain-containing protein n=1 Tax=Takifugu rubripes TaxID=31033 RepID=A0A3B5KSY4_TAKRU
MHPTSLAPPAGGEPTGRGSHVASLGCARPNSIGRGPATRRSPTCPTPRPGFRRGPRSTRPAGFISRKSMALSGSFSLTDRPLVSQGISGMPISAPCRQRKSKSYYVGLLQEKNQDIAAEISKLENHIKKFSIDEADYLHVVEQNKTLAHDIKDLEGQVADYHLLAGTPQYQTDANKLYMEYKRLKIKNNRETERNNNIFMKRAEVEESMKKLQRTNDIVKEALESMCPSKQKEYFSMATANLELLKKMDILQEEMDLLVKRKEDYEAELAHNNDKSEMLTLYKELTVKWETLQAGRKAQDPQGMEPLIKKMEKDSKELASIEKQLADLRDKEKEMKQRIHQFPDYMKEYDMLKMREEKLDQLLASVEIAKAAEQEKIPHIQENIASLSQLCYSYVRNCCMDSETAEKLKKMMTLVVNNSTKAIQLESSARRLAPEIELLRQDLKQVHTWKSKVCRDLSSLKEQTSIVESELGTHRTQRRSAHKSEKKLHEEYELLTKRQRYFRQVLEDLNHEFNNLRKGLMKTEEKQKTLEVLSGLSKFDSYHPLEHKLGVIKTLQHWAKEVPTTSQGRKKIQDHIKTALKTCGYPDWAFTKTKKMRPLQRRGGEKQTPQHLEQG